MGSTQKRVRFHKALLLFLVLVALAACAGGAAAMRIEESETLANNDLRNAPNPYDIELRFNGKFVSQDPRIPIRIPIGRPNDTLSAHYISSGKVVDNSWRLEASDESIVSADLRWSWPGNIWGWKSGNVVVNLRSTISPDIVAVSCDVEVVPIVAILGVRTNRYTHALKAGQTFDLFVEPHNPSNASRPVYYTFESSNPDVAVVQTGSREDPYRTIQARAPGKTTIEITADNAADYMVGTRCYVTVVAADAPVPVTAIYLDQTEAATEVGETFTLSVASMEPEEPDAPIRYTFYSSDPSIARVEPASSGQSHRTISAISKGEATITVTADNAAAHPVSASCRVAVAAPSDTPDPEPDHHSGGGGGCSTGMAALPLLISMFCLRTWKRRG